MTTRLAEVIGLALKAQAIDLHVSCPGRIVRFDADTQLADVKPIIRQIRPRDGKKVTLPLPVITGVPVQFAGAGGFRLTFPVKKGEPCWLIFADGCIDKYVHKGGEDVDPLDPRTHDLSDAVCILGLRSLQDRLRDVSTNSMKIGKDGGDAQIELFDDRIELGGNSDYAALASKVDDVAEVLKAAINTHSHVVTGTAAAATTNGVLQSLPSVASSKVRLS